MEGAPGATQLTASTADQTAEYIWVNRVSTRELLVGSQTPLRRGEDFCGNECWYRHGDPLLTRGGLGTHTTSHRLKGRTPLMRWSAREASAHCFTDVRGIVGRAAQRRHEL